MTEREWLECTDPTPMLRFLQGKVTDRKVRLFTCACCRRVLGLIPDERSREAIKVAERFADKQASEEELHNALRAAWAAHDAVWDESDCRASPNEAEVYYATNEMEAAFAVVTTCKATLAFPNELNIAFPPLPPVDYAVGKNERSDIESERSVQTSLVRDIFGNPFLPITINPAWLAWNDGTVRRIAQTIYDERAFDRMPLLADALTDAGCDNADVLSHCRGDGPHVKGCWVVDLALGKE